MNALAKAHQQMREDGAPPELLEFTCYDNNNNEVKVLPEEPVSRQRR